MLNQLLEVFRQQNLQIFGIKFNNIVSICYPIEVVLRGSDAQLRVGEN